MKIKTKKQKQEKTQNILNYHSIYTFDKYDTILRNIFYSDKNLISYYHLLGDLEYIQNMVKLECKIGGVKC